MDVSMDYYWDLLMGFAKVDLKDICAAALRADLWDSKQVAW